MVSIFLSLIFFDLFWVLLFVSIFDTAPKRWYPQKQTDTAPDCQWLKKRVPKWNPGKWKRTPPWSILSHTQIVCDSNSLGHHLLFVLLQCLVLQVVQLKELQMPQEHRLDRLTPRLPGNWRHTSAPHTG